MTLYMACFKDKILKTIIRIKRIIVTELQNNEGVGSHS